MALHAKLQLSARRWRAPLWPVVLPLCDWLAGWGRVETSLPPSLPSLSLLLPFPLYISCCTVQSDAWIILCVRPYVLVLVHSSNFAPVARNVWGLQSVSISHQLFSGVLKERRLFLSVDFITTVEKKAFHHVLSFWFYFLYSSVNHFHRKH